MDQAAPPTPESSYFLTTEYSNKPPSKFIEKLKKLWQAFQYYARMVWPWVNRLLSFIVYETIRVIKGIVKIGLQQVGMFKE